MNSLEQDMAQSMERALIFGAFLDGLSAPTPSQLWLENAAAGLNHARDPNGEKQDRRDRIITRLLARDGDECWFCAKPLGVDVSIEHLQPRALGGSWADSNLALAHVACNKAAGHLSRIKKEHMRDEMRNQVFDAIEGKRV